MIHKNHALCRHCKHSLNEAVVDLGFAPASNAYLCPDQLQKPELYYPLRLQLCENCGLLQTQDYAHPELLFSNDYAYFSSTSTSWLAHAKRFAGMITKRLALKSDSFVVEVAANDGYLLKHFLTAGIPCLGIEPTQSTADKARTFGIPIEQNFFTESLAQKIVSSQGKATLICANNVYAHVPDINDFTRGLATLLSSEGTITLEFPHLMRLLMGCQFDTIYHEHYSYLSLHAVLCIMKSCGLRLYDVEELPTHGGSLRIYACHEKAHYEQTGAIERILQEEQNIKIKSPEPYLNLQSQAEAIKLSFLHFLLERKQQGDQVAAYGAAAKGNTLLNFAGVKPDLLPAIYDSAPSKQGRLLPGSHIPVLGPDTLYQNWPDYLIILPWNIFDEIHASLKEKAPKHVKFVTFVPELKII